MRKKIFFLFIPIFLFSKPVKVDDILTEKNIFMLDSSISYSNINREDGVLSPSRYQTQNGDFVTIPTYLGESESNQDYIGYALTLRYGINKYLEVFSSINFFTADTHFRAGDLFGTESTKGFYALNLGFTYQVKKEDEKPSLLIGSSISTIERTQFSNSIKNIYFKNYNFFLTSFYTVDPIVFLVKASYSLSLKQSDNNSSVDNGEIFVLSPQVYFAVNPYTSMNWGVRYSYHDKSKMDGLVVSGSGSDVAYIFGMSYEINAKTTLNVDAEYSSGVASTQNNIAFGLSYKF